MDCLTDGGTIMIVDLVDKLLDRLLELVKLSKQARKERFQSLVQEAFAEFEAIHNNYLQSFRSYRARLADGSASMPMIIQVIREECLFTEHQRAKLRQLSELLAAETKQYGDFFVEIHSYLTTAHDVEPVNFPPDYFAQTGQRWFHGLLNALVDLDQLLKGGEVNEDRPLPVRNLVHEALESTDDESKAAVYLIDRFVEQLQSSFEIVSREYARLKQKSQS